MKNKSSIILIVFSLIIASIWFSQNTKNSATEEIVEVSLDAKKMAKKERKMRRDEQEFKMTVDPQLGIVPYEELLRARKTQLNSFKKDDGTRGAIPGVNWVNYGPTNQGGRVRAIMFDPNDATNKAVFAGAISGGLWKTSDVTSSTTSWVKNNDFLDNLTISTLAADPNNSMIMYAGTGEAYSDVTPGNGIYKSIDGGSTWTLLPSTTSSFKYATDMLVRNESGTSVIYVGQKQKALDSKIQTGGTTDFIGTSGLFRSTDGGTTWTQVMINADGGESAVIDNIRLDANGHLWISTGVNAFDNAGGDIYTCNTGCGTAANWTKKYDASAQGDTTVQITVFDIAPSNANIIYAIGGNINGMTDIEFFIKSIDGGTTWTNIPIPFVYEISDCTLASGHFTNGQATYDICIRIHPTDPNIVLFGGIDVHRTIDGFSTQDHIGSWYSSIAPCDKYIHADQHDMIFRPGFPNEAIFANDGGVAYSADAGNSAVSSPNFSENTKDMVTGQIYAIDLSPTAGQDEYLAGLQDNGSKDWDQATGTVTIEASGGDGGYCHIDQTQPNIQISSYTYNNYFVTTDEWATKDEVNNGSTQGRFINPTDYDDTNNILYGTDTINRLSMMTAVGTSNTYTGGILVGGAGLGGSQATTLRVDRNTNTTLYVGTDDGKVFKILNANTGTLVSTDISPSLPSGAWVSSIDVEVGNSNHMLVTASNYGVSSVWESTNGGTSWTDIEGDLPNLPVRGGVFSPVNNDHVLLATDLGMWTTDNIDGASTSWAATNNGFANVRTDMIQYRTSDNTMVVGTFGRGMYKYKFGSKKSLAISGLRLQGAMPETGTTMTTNINANIPLTDPYGLSTTATSIPANAVDWIKIELFSVSSSEVGSAAGFLLADGTVKAVDGQDISFDAVADGNYYVNVRHRNHLPILTDGTIALAAGTVAIDFNTVALYTDPAITTNGPTTTINGVKALWAGDVDNNNKVRYLSQLVPLVPSDALTILSTGLGGVPNATISNAYSVYDVNMDGYVRYLIQAVPLIPSDALFILSNPLGGVPNEEVSAHQ